MAKWIWYPGSLELYHGMLLHNRRTHAKTYKDCDGSETKSVFYYPSWRVDGPKRNAKLFKEADISEPETIEFYANTTDACISVDGRSYPVGSKITLEAGHHNVCVMGFKSSSFPAFYCKGKVFESDRSWLVANDDDKAHRHVGDSDLYTSLDDDCEIFKFSYKRIDPQEIRELDGGILYDFGKEVFGKITICDIPSEYGELLLSLGESFEEATDFTNANCVINAVPKNGSFTSLASALRYIYIPNCRSKPKLFLDFEYLPLERKGSFRCNDELINKLWDTCEYTLLLNSREGFFDGIKRDRWVWSGDAYQSFLVNYYLYANKDIVRRTLRMLRGGDPISKHMNTICDYTFYWFIGIWEYYFHTGDIDFIKDIYPDMLDVWAFLEKRLSDDGMYVRLPDDWVFIDWSTFDSNGPMCAEQMLLCKAYESMGKCANINGDSKMSERCEKQVAYMKDKINELYWDSEKGAFIDDYVSGKRNVTRHANIFALLFDYTSPSRKESIIKNVIYNDNITKITTPYFEFFELDAMCQIGDFKYMTDMLYSYWGGMLRLGATTIWEEFDPTKSGIEHYEMYGGKYEKSLCHAWGASPIYLLGKYALGVRPTDVGYKSFEVVPNLMCFKGFEGKVPTPTSDIYVKMTETEISVLAGVDGGVLVLGDKRYTIVKDKMLTVKI